MKNWKKRWNCSICQEKTYHRMIQMLWRLSTHKSWFKELKSLKTLFKIWRISIQLKKVWNSRQLFRIKVNNWVFSRIRLQSWLRENAKQKTYSARMSYTRLSKNWFKKEMRLSRVLLIIYSKCNSNKLLVREARCNMQLLHWLSVSYLKLWWMKRWELNHRI